MAVTFDAAGPSSSGASSATSPLTWSHTCAAGDTMLLVGVAVDSLADGGITAACTYNGVSMTASTKWHSGGVTQAFGFIQLFTMANPPTGSAFTVSASAAGATLDSINGGSLSFAGSVGLGTPVTADSNSVNVTTGTISVPTTSASSQVAVIVCNGSGGLAFTTGTSRYVVVAGGGSGGAGWSGGATIAGTGSNVVVNWNQNSDFYAAIGVEVQAASSGASTITTYQMRRIGH